MLEHTNKTIESKSIKKAVKKFGTTFVNTDRIVGTVEIVGYRKYEIYEEVDIVFKGKIKARVDFSNPEWIDLSDIKKYGGKISKVKLNRFIRNSLFFDLSCRMKYFGIDLKTYKVIKKIKWI